MSLQHQEDSELISEIDTESLQDDKDRRRRPSRAWVNWALALRTVPAAALVMIFGVGVGVGVGAALSDAACSGAQCPDLGPHGLVYGVLLYGAPAVAALTIIASFFNATRRRGFLIPLSGLALLLCDVAVMSILFSK